MDGIVFDLNTTRLKIYLAITLLISAGLVVIAVTYREQNGLTASIVVGAVAGALALVVLANLRRAFGKRPLVIDAAGIRVRDRYGWEVTWSEGADVTLLRWHTQMKRVPVEHAGLRFHPSPTDADFGARHRFLRRLGDGSFSFDLPAMDDLAELDRGLREFAGDRYRGLQDLGRNTATGET